jgi:hypothetical protein
MTQPIMKDGKKSIVLLLLSFGALIYTTWLYQILRSLANTSFFSDHGVSHEQFSTIMTHAFPGLLLGTLLGLFLVDLLGGLRSLMLSMLFALSGIIILTYGQDISYLFLGYLLINVSSSLIFIAMFKQIDRIFTAPYFALGVGMVMPIAFINTDTFVTQGFSWQIYLNGLIFIGAIIFLLLAVVWFFSERKQFRKAISLTEIISTITLPSFWFAVIAVFLIRKYEGLLSLLQQSWMMEQIFQFSTQQLEHVALAAITAFSMGGLLLGYFSRHIRFKRSVILSGFVLSAAALYFITQYQVTTLWSITSVTMIGALGASVVVLLYERLRSYSTVASIGFTIGLLQFVKLNLNLGFTALVPASIQMPSSYSDFASLAELLMILFIIGSLISLALRPAIIRETSTTLGQDLKQCWRGEAGLGRTFWVVYFLGHAYLTFLLAGILYSLLSTGFLYAPTLSPFYSAPAIFMASIPGGPISLLLVPFDIFVLICIWRCAFNTKRGRTISYLTRTFVILSFLILALDFLTIPLFIFLSH